MSQPSNPGPPPSRPSGVHYPRTTEGAHQRLDAHDMALAQMGEIMHELRTAFGSAPNTVTGEPGSGVLLYLDKIAREREQELRSQETWRRRWTALAAAVAFVGGLLAILDRFGVFAAFKP